MSQTLVDNLLRVLEQCRSGWPAKKPYPLNSGNSLLSTEVCRQAAVSALQLPWRRAATDFYTQFETYLHEIPDLLPPWDRIYQAVCEPEVTRAAEQLWPASRPLSIASVNLHRLVKGDRIEVHNDCNDFGECLRLCWLFGPRDFSGGDFAVHAAETEDSILYRLPPEPDTWVCFAIGPDSFHSVTPVQVTTGAGRLSMIITWQDRDIAGGPIP